jgi:hypothetical protein
MLVLGTDWATISSLATAGGTLVLAIATFAAVRSSNRSARIAEVALQEQRRPILTQSRPDDPLQKIMFVEQHWVRAGGGHGVAEHVDGNLYFAISLRNVGAGIGVCQGWHVAVGLQSGRLARSHTPEDQFRLQTRDLYIPAGDIGMWQGALRDRRDPTYQAVAEAIDNQEVVSVELLYSDQVGDQRTISRFGLVPYQTQEGEVRWFAAINRHWYLDRTGPRSEDEVAAATDTILREREAAERALIEEAETVSADGAASGEADASETPAPEGAEPERRGAEPEPQAAEPEPDRRTREPEPVAVIPRPNCE